MVKKTGFVVFAALGLGVLFTLAGPFVAATKRLSMVVRNAGATETMTATELESRFCDRIKEISCLLLLPAPDARQLVGDCATADGVRLLGVEAYRILDDGRVQPSIEFSNISFGQVELDGGTMKVTSLERGLREPWGCDRNLYQNTQKLIDEGVSNGYDWFEVSVEDVNTGALLFFRVRPDTTSDGGDPE